PPRRPRTFPSPRRAASSSGGPALRSPSTCGRCTRPSPGAWPGPPRLRDSRRSSSCHHPRRAEELVNHPGQPGVHEEEVEAEEEAGPDDDPGRPDDLAPARPAHLLHLDPDVPKEVPGPRPPLSYRYHVPRSPRSDPYWQGWRDSTPQPTVLETAALPIRATPLMVRPSPLCAPCACGRTGNTWRAPISPCSSSCSSSSCSCAACTRCTPD